MTSRVLLALLLLPACGDDGSAPGADAGDAIDAAPSPDAGPEPTLAGRVRVAEERASWGANGAVWAEFDSPHVPRFHTETMNDGTCRLLEFQQDFCPTPCMGICLPGGVCESFPELLRAGRLTFTGLKTALAIDPDMYGWYYPPGVLPNDLFDAGDPVGVSAAGDEFPAFTVAATGVDTIFSPTIGVDGDGIQYVDLPNGADFSFAWTPAAGDTRVRLTINANNQGHGAPYRAILVCDAPDAAGGVTIPRAMIDAFPETQAWQACAGSDCPPSRLARYTRSLVDTAGGAVELTVSSEILFGVNHPLP